MKEQFFTFAAHGSYSESHNWDAGLEPITLTPCSEEEYKEALQGPQYRIGHFAAYSWVATAYGGSRTLRGCVRVKPPYESVIKDILDRQFAEEFPQQQ